MKIIHPLLRLSLPYQVLIGVIAGVLFGLFAGDKAAVFEPVGQVYTMLMEVVVFPYLICTLLTSLGDLTPTLSLKLFKKGGIIYLFLLALVFSALLILAQALPINITTVAPLNADSVSHARLISYLVPQNFFNDLAQNYVPAVIIFCILFGLTLQFVPNKAPFFHLLNTISQTCLLFWRGLVKLAPLATFALLADVAGTMRFFQLYDLSEFLILFIIGTLSLIFWIIPVTISCFTNIEYRSLMYALRDALIISAVTTLSVVALPYIQTVTEKFLAARKKEYAAEKVDTKEKSDILQTILLVNYPFAQLGNFFVYLFILFSVLYFNHTLTYKQYVILPILSFLSSIGSPTSSINAVSFLAQILNLPQQATTLYVTLIPLIRYPQVLLSVMGFAFITIIVAFSFFRLLKINYHRLFLHYFLFFLLIIASVFALKNVFPNSGEKNYARLNSFSLPSDLVSDVIVTMAPPFDESKVVPVKNSEDSLFSIQKTGVLRVGYNTDMRPFAFENDKHELVGYDISYAYALAKALKARIEFVPFTWQYLVSDLLADKFDIAMSAIYVTEERLKLVSFTTPYFHSPLSLIVPKNQENKFNTATQIKNYPRLKIGIFNDPVLIPLIQHNFSNAKIIILPDLSGEASSLAFKQKEIDVVLWSQAQTDVWVLDHPHYVSVVPSGVAAPFLMAYMLQRSSPQFLRFLNYWLELKKNDNFQQQMYNQWILIRPVEDHEPRWSVLRNVLHWE